MFSGKFNLVCFMVGMLTLGEAGVHVMASSDTTVEDVRTRNLIAVDVDDEMEIEYQNLEEEERSCRERLQEKEAELKAGGEVSQIEIMDLNEKLRTIQSQKMVLKSRMEQ